MTTSHNALRAGGRFLMVKDMAVSQGPAAGVAQTNFIVVLNWVAELTQKLPAR